MSKEREEEPKLLDIIEAKNVEVRIRNDRKVLWINTENGCILRIGKIDNLVIRET